LRIDVGGSEHVGDEDGHLGPGQELGRAGGRQEQQLGPALVVGGDHGPPGLGARRVQRHLDARRGPPGRVLYPDLQPARGSRRRRHSYLDLQRELTAQMSVSQRVGVGGPRSARQPHGGQGIELAEVSGA
jgi:hypothetical protein